MVKICEKCLVAWPGGYRCDQCGGPLTHTSDDRAHELPDVVWRNQRVDYGARRGMVFRFQAMFLGIVLGLLGVRASFGLESPWSIIGALASIIGGIVFYWIFHEAAHRAVRIWVLRSGQLSRKKLAKAVLAPVKRRERAPKPEADEAAAPETTEPAADHG